MNAQSASGEVPVTMTVPARLLRVLDSMAVGLSTVMLVLVYSPLRNTISGRLGNVYVVPLAITVGAVFLLPKPQAAGRLALVRQQLQLSGLLAVTMAPFISWWMRAFGSNYLLICALIGTIAIVAFLMNTAALCAEILRLCQQPAGLVAVGRVVRELLLYVSLVPILTAGVTAGLALLVNGDLALLDIQMFWYQIPGSLRLVMLLPVAATAGLLWRTRVAVLKTAPRF